MKHQKVIDAIQTNIDEEGDCIAITLGDTISCVGTLAESDLEDFLQTIFISSPGFKELVARAMDNTSCSLH